MISFEVGEHVPHHKEGVVIRNLHAHNCVGVILSWAVLGQRGHHHVNNHANDYLVDIFQQLGYRHDHKASQAFRATAREHPQSTWFTRSTMVFQRLVSLEHC